MHHLALLKYRGQIPDPAVKIRKSKRSLTVRRNPVAAMQMPRTLPLNGLTRLGETIAWEISILCIVCLMSDFPAASRTHLLYTGANASFGRDLRAL